MNDSSEPITDEELDNIAGQALLAVDAFDGWSEAEMTAAYEHGQEAAPGWVLVAPGTASRLVADVRRLRAVERSLIERLDRPVPVPPVPSCFVCGRDDIRTIVARKLKPTEVHHLDGRTCRISVVTSRAKPHSG